MASEETAFDILTLAFKTPAAPGAAQELRGVSITAMTVRYADDGTATLIADPTARDLAGMADHPTFKKLVGDLAAGALRDIKAERDTNAAAVAELRAKLQAAQDLGADLRAVLAGQWAAAEAAWCDASARAAPVPYVDWGDVLDNARNPDSPDHAEASALLDYDTGTVARSIAAAKAAGTSPRDWLVSEPLYAYDAAPAPAST